MSAIKYVVQPRLCTKARLVGTFQKFNLQDPPEKCIFDEDLFVEEVLKKGEVGGVELGPSILAELTRSLWEEVDETGPNILFVYFSKVNALQSNLAKQYCDGMQPMQADVGRNTALYAKKYVIRTRSGGEALLDDWVKAKHSTIKFALKLSGGSCKHKTRKVEDALNSCGEKGSQMFAAE